MQNNKSIEDKPSISKTKSFMPGLTKKPQNDSVKRKSFILNDVVKSLDLGLGRMKKTKLANGEYFCTSSHTSPTRRNTAADLFIDSLKSGSEVDTASMMSMNFSHYELMRNLSRSNCNSDTSFSTTTVNAGAIPFDSSRNEHLERYFRSVEKWRRNPDRSGHEN